MDEHHRMNRDLSRIWEPPPSPGGPYRAPVPPETSPVPPASPLFAPEAPVAAPVPPALRTDRELTDRLDAYMDDNLASPGLKFERDVRPWLGSQLAVVGWQRGTSAEGAVLIRSTDDGRAADALATARSHTGGTWSEQ